MREGSDNNQTHTPAHMYMYMHMYMCSFNVFTLRLFTALSFQRLITHNNNNNNNSHLQK